MDEKIIAVMGATGSGKSSFVNLVTGNETAKVGHGLTSETQEIMASPFRFAGFDIVLVDTPGFDDTNRKDADILQSLVEWLQESYRQGTKLSGIIYLHRITDVRMSGSAIRNLRVFRELCGSDYFKHVVLCTTFWDTANESEQTLNTRFNELTTTEGWWGGMIARGSKVFKEPLTRAGAVQLIYELIDKPKIALKVQKETVDENKSLRETSTFATLLELEMEDRERKHQEQLAQLREELEQHKTRSQRTHSENLEWMREEWKRKEAESEAIRKDLQSKLVAMNINAEESKNPGSNASYPARNRTGLPEDMEKLHRSTTVAGDDISLFEQAVNRRSQRYAKFVQTVGVTLQVLDKGKSSGNVKCDFLGRKSCYLMVCVNCLENIGGHECYSESSHAASSKSF